MKRIYSFSLELDQFSSDSPLLPLPPGDYFAAYLEDFIWFSSECDGSDCVENALHCRVIWEVEIRSDIAGF